MDFLPQLEAVKGIVPTFNGTSEEYLREYRMSDDSTSLMEVTYDVAELDLEEGEVEMQELDLEEGGQRNAGSPGGSPGSSGKVAKKGAWEDPFV
mmetsp:Transcript_32416/g.103180  ORF Transcript_32416/g.103180 Transcript_32416/m.103180 type:complete len:94 (-) Transcript_32416:6-287(-)